MSTISEVDDFERCRKVQKLHGKGYYFATRFFSKEKRLAIYALYAWVRTLDDIVDEERSPQKAQALFADFVSDWQEILATGHSQHFYLRAFHEVYLKYEIDSKYTEAFIKAMRQDLEQTRYHNYAELEDYMYGSATVVGLMLLQIVGAHNEKTLPYAKALAEAMQLTNFLRDVKDDYENRGRVYLPLDQLSKFGLSVEDIANQKLTREFVVFKINEARNLFTIARSGIQHLPHTSRFAISLSANIYEAILDKITEQNFDVFIKRARVSKAEKLIILCKTLVWPKEK